MAPPEPMQAHSNTPGLPQRCHGAVAGPWPLQSCPAWRRKGLTGRTLGNLPIPSCWWSLVGAEHLGAKKPPSSAGGRGRAQHSTGGSQTATAAEVLGTERWGCMGGRCKDTAPWQVQICGLTPQNTFPSRRRRTWVSFFTITPFPKDCRFNNLY